MDQAYFDRNKFEAFYLLPRERINGTETEASLVLHLHRNGAGDVHISAFDIVRLTTTTSPCLASSYTFSLSVKLTTTPKLEFGVL